MICFGISVLYIKQFVKDFILHISYSNHIPHLFCTIKIGNISRNELDCSFMILHAYKYGGDFWIYFLKEKKRIFEAHQDMCIRQKELFDNSLPFNFCNAQAHFPIVMIIS